MYLLYYHCKDYVCLNPSIAAAVCTTPCSCNSHVVYTHGNIQADNRMNTLIIISHVNTCMYTIINLHVVQLLFFIHVMHIHHYNILRTFEHVDSWYCVGRSDSSCVFPWSSPSDKIKILSPAVYPPTIKGHHFRILIIISLIKQFNILP